MGRLRWCQCGVEISAFVPLNTAHRFWNSSTERTVFEVEIRPARNFEKAIRAQLGLVEDGKTNEEAIPKNILELALLYELSESYVVGMPLSLQKGIFGALARVARWSGYDPEFSKYTKPDGGVAEGGAGACSFGDGARYLDSANGDACALVVALATQPPEQNKVAFGTHFREPPRGKVVRRNPSSAHSD
jgi:hypothetical protein